MLPLLVPHCNVPERYHARQGTWCLDGAAARYFLGWCMSFVITGYLLGRACVVCVPMGSECSNKFPGNFFVVSCPGAQRLVFLEGLHIPAPTLSEAEKGVSHPNPFTSYLDGLCTTSPGRLRPKPVCRVDGLALFYGSGGNWLGLLTLRTPMSYNLTMALASSSPISHMKAPRVAWSKRRDRLVSSSNASSGNHTPGRTLSETRVWEGKGHSTVEQYR